VTSTKDPSRTKEGDVKIAMAVESKYLYARDDAIRNVAQKPGQKVPQKDAPASKSTMLGSTKLPEAGAKRKFQELEKFMSEDSEDFEEQVRSRQKRAKRDDARQKFESGSEEEYVIGNTMAAKKD
jgi:hypothetical protein